MFNYKKPKNKNYRYNSEDYMPRIIEKMYKLGRSFTYEQNNPQMNYSIKINKLKTSTKELNNQIKIYRENLDNLFNENNRVSSKLKNDYNNVKNELNNNIQTIKIKIDEYSIEQKKFNEKINKDFLDLKQSDINIKNLINNISQKLEKINKKIYE